MLNTCIRPQAMVIKIIYNRGPQSVSCGLVRGHDLLATGPWEWLTSACRCVRMLHSRQRHPCRCQQPCLRMLTGASSPFAQVRRHQCCCQPATGACGPLAHARGRQHHHHVPICTCTCIFPCSPLSLWAANLKSLGSSGLEYIMVDK